MLGMSDPPKGPSAMMAKKAPRTSPKIRLKVVGAALALGIIAPLAIVLPALYMHLFSASSVPVPALYAGGSQRLPSGVLGEAPTPEPQPRELPDFGPVPVFHDGQVYPAGTVFKDGGELTAIPAAAAAGGDGGGESHHHEESPKSVARAPRRAAGERAGAAPHRERAEHRRGAAAHHRGAAAEEEEERPERAPPSPPGPRPARHVVAGSSFGEEVEREDARTLPGLDAAAPATVHASSSVDALLPTLSQEPAAVAPAADGRGPGAGAADDYVPDQSELTAGPCGRRGTAGAGGKCTCTTLWRGSKCTEGEVFKFDEKYPAVFRPAGFLKDITMSSAGLALGDREMKIHLPGKDPAWRYIAKAKGDLLKMVPATCPLQAEKYKSCALVGNSGILLNTEQGDAINQHDMIFRFNGAPTKGFERFVGSRTDFRLSNSKWNQFRETKSERILHNMRAASALEYYKERMRQDPKERFHIFSHDFVNYVGQTVAQLSKSFTGKDAKAFEALAAEGFTPTSGFTGLLIAINLCSKVTMYGMQVSETQGFPYHYHNRCPQPFGERDKAEWLLFRRMVELGLANFNEPCIVECQGEGKECNTCRAAHQEVYARQKTDAGMALWERNPLPEYCENRARLLERERTHLAQGGAPWTKAERDVVMAEIVAEFAKMPSSGRKGVPHAKGMGSRKRRRRYA